MSKDLYIEYCTTNTACDTEFGVHRTDSLVTTVADGMMVRTGMYGCCFLYVLIFSENVMCEDKYEVQSLGVYPWVHRRESWRLNVGDM